jgi:hypothetical protein
MDTDVPGFGVRVSEAGLRTFYFDHRTRLASLRVPDLVAEMVIGHGRKGLQRVYDQHTYEAEMREALNLWASRLRDIVTPPPENVVRMRGRV